jgi:Putative Ig domain
MGWFNKKKRPEVITLKGTFTVVLTVDTPTPPIQVATPEDLGPAEQPLPAGAKLGISGGTPPYAVSNLQGTPPPGVSINTDGSLTGTPTTPGSFTISVDVADANG